MTVTAYKILTRGEWESLKAEGTFAGAPVDLADGYIHLSAPDQVAETAAKHFAGRDDLVLAEVDLRKLEGVKWEPSRGGQLFPHIYGVLPLAAVVRTEPLQTKK
ncbi:DUF952 domain-containing protein [Sphingosinicella microcystinivorans]|uniref:Uncharacterized protein (DUF952 family) n=1 Tax=Sphingosinicella microcystinivorans TaxID=335406 RepID=A0AAD1D8X5_SPHMI|nr:DUF952 domain-containing protein [Sphingosinicella microcystinivorans]RKS86443.1 uncharacterized protein (DUF952 family) [Sphingosinicella microcystinivorans]BBE35454.1 hypothetical protein SmB9_31120 [Sphingosinicella microcystinivorans]